MALLKILLRDALCPLDDDEFRSLVMDTFREMFGSMTDEQLLCLPSESKRFDRMIRHLARCQGLSDTLINRTLMNCRKAGKLPPPPSRDFRIVLRLSDELKAAGSDKDPEAFRELIMDMFAENYRDMTDEDLLCNPDRLIPFDDLIRCRARCVALTDGLINRTLINMRKRSKSQDSAA
jgi:hypothetical protein